MSSLHEETVAYDELQALVSRFSRLLKVRPAILASTLLKILGPEERRRIVQTEDGLRLYLDPFSRLGRNILSSGTYEPETKAIICRCLRPGDVFWDIGANEGFFSALGAKIVGERGLVVSVEPQKRLCDIIRINVLLNNPTPLRVFNNAIGGDDGESTEINLWPSINSGASSLATSYRMSRARQEVAFISPESIFEKCGRRLIRLIKVDVEGFEGHVVPRLLPALRTGKVQHLLVDYHESQLAKVGKDPNSIHGSLLQAGCAVIENTPTHFDGYVLYKCP